MSYKFGKWELESPLIAAGTSASRLQDLEGLQRSALGGSIIKSISLEDCAGNPEINYWSDGMVDVNAQGLPNPGIDKARGFLEEHDKIRNRSHLLILGVVAMKPQDRDDLFREAWKLQERGLVDGVEDNLSCPNVPGKPIVSYDNESMREFGLKVMRDYPKMNYGMKMAPFYERRWLDNIADNITEHFGKNPDTKNYEAVFENALDFDWDEITNIYFRTYEALQNAGLSFISAVNSVPNLMITRADGKSVLNPKSNGGRGGLSGEFMHQLALDNVNHFSICFRGLPIIGTGGVVDGEGVRRMLKAGAKAVGLGTALMRGGPKAAEKIAAEYVDLPQPEVVGPIRGIAW